MSVASDLEHLELEKQKVALLRNQAEPDDALPKTDDYVIIDGKYRLVRVISVSIRFQSPLPPPL